MTWPPSPNAPVDPQIRAFLDAIADEPTDASVRLVFADWLEERGDPRAELLRIQAEHLNGGSASALERREQSWMSAQGRDWLGGATACGEVRPAEGLLAVHYSDADDLLDEPAAEGLRQAVREGWFRVFQMAHWHPRHIRRAADLGLLSDPAVLEWGAGRFTDDCLACLADRTQLRELVLEGQWATVTDQGLASLAGLVRLRSLTLRAVKGPTLAGLARLSGLKNLRSLYLFDFRNLNDSELPLLKALPALESLSLVHCESLTDAGLAHLSALKHLRELDLGSNHQLTEEGLKHLGKLTGLERLSLVYCDGVTLAGLAHLYHLTNLRWLDTRACRLKPHETRALRKAMPHCEVPRSK